MKVKSLDLGKEPILSLLLKMSLPSVAAMFVMGVYNFVDAIWLARSSTHALAAYTVSFPLQLLLFSVGLGTGIGSGSYASRMFGANNVLQARRVAGQTLFLSLTIGGGIALLVFLFCDEILLFMGTSPEVIPLARHYLHIYIIGTPLLLFVMMTNNLMRAEGRPKASMGIILVFALVGLFLDPLFIFGWGVVPALGLRGAALASLVAQGSAALFASYCLYRSASRYEIGWAQMRPSFFTIWSIYKTGLPSIVMNLLFTVTIVLFNHALAPFGAASIASLGISLRTVGLINMVLIGIGHAVMPIIGFSKGADLRERLAETVRKGNIVATLLALVCSVIIIIFAPTIVGIFTVDALLIDYGVFALRMFTLPLVLSAPTIIWINMFLGLGEGTTALVLMSLRDCIFLAPLVLLLPRWFGFEGIWIAYFISVFLAFLVIFFVARHSLHRWHHNPQG
ncbi:MAG: MATE family efflux transporter [Deltaproteobacteria bacterium]|nr:MATE family efflux transporter [Deltaproteobacteria bacterium]